MEMRRNYNHVQNTQASQRQNNSMDIYGSNGGDPYDKVNNSYVKSNQNLSPSNGQLSPNNG